jgi:hypothetical protein
MSALLAVLLALPVRAAVVAPEGLPVLPAAATAGASAAGAALAAAPLTAAPALSAAPVAAPSIPQGPAALDAPEPGPAAAPAADPAAVLGLSAEQRLTALFPALDRERPLPAGSPAAWVRERVRAQLLKAAREYDAPEPELLETVARETDKALVRIQARLDAGEIDPAAAALRLSAADPEPAAGARRVRVGVYPVAADPFQWGHLIVALRAVGELGLDKVVFVLAGDDPRKPHLTPVEHRHPMGREVLDAFAPFFAYSPIAVGTTHDGETNIFRLLALNPSRRVEAWYMVGDDHYRLTDKKGNPDTLPKLEANLRSAMGHNAALHELKVAFIRREHPAEEVPTDLEVRFLDHVGFEASSTQVRGGRHALMPHAAFDYARREVPGLYGVTPPPAPDAD